MASFKKTRKFVNTATVTIAITMSIISFFIAYYVWNRSHSQIIDNLELNMESLIKLTANEMNLKLQQYEQKTIFIAKRLESSSNDTLSIEQTISKSLLQDSSLLSAFVFIEKNNAPSCYSKFFFHHLHDVQQCSLEEKMGKNSIDNLMEEAKKTSDFFCTPPFYSDVNKHIESCFWYPVYEDQQVIGIFGLNILLDNCFTDFYNQETSQPVYFILSDEGILLTPLFDIYLSGIHLFDLAKEQQEFQLMNISKFMMNGEKERFRLMEMSDGTQFYFTCIPLKKAHISLGMLMDKNSVMSDFKLMNKNMILFLLLEIVVILLVIYLLIRTRMKYLTAISKSTKLIGKGMFTEALPEIETRDEFFVLRNDLHDMQQQLLNYYSHLKFTTQQEECFAQEHIQYQYFKKNILPIDYRKFVFGNSDYFEFKIDYHPAKRISGDFYDYFFINENKICMVFGNVSEKGAILPLFISFIMSYIRNEIHEKINLNKFAEKFNDVLFTQNDHKRVIKLWIAVFDSKSRIFNFINIGYDLMYIIRNQTITNINTLHGLAIGVVEEAHFSDSSLELHATDTVIIGSNVIPSLLDNRGVNFGKEMFEQILTSFKSELPVIMLKKISDEIEIHLNNVKRTEDYTLLAIKVF